VLALLRRLWYEQIMNKPAQLALAHRPTAQPGPQFDGTAPAGPQIGGANPSKPILAERTQAHGQRLYNPLVQPFRHFPQTKPSSANEANWENVVKTMFEDERDEPCPHERSDFRFH
jgi:hypothetical protein